MRPALRNLGVRLAWLACAVLIALGSAGIVAGGAHQPGTAARAELTWRADEAIRPDLEAAIGGLDALADQVGALGTEGRRALVALVDRDLATLAAAIADGERLVDGIASGTEALRARLAGLPGVGPGMEGRLGAGVRARHAAAVAALDATDGLGDSWTTLTSASLAAMRLTTLLADHDRYAAEAARLGSGASYASALEQLEAADAALADARDLRDALANSADVTVLDQWLGRNAALDEALRALYTALRASRGTVTKAVRDALAAEQEAEARLPPDTRGLVVIMGDIARGGMNQAAIAIEQAKGRLNAAVDALLAPEPGTAAGVPADPPAVTPAP